MPPLYITERNQTLGMNNNALAAFAREKAIAKFKAAERAAASEAGATRGRNHVARALAHAHKKHNKHNEHKGGRRTRRSSGVMGSVKKFFGMTRRSRGRSRRQ